MKDFDFLFFADHGASPKRAAASLARMSDAARGPSEPKRAPQVLERQKAAMDRWWSDPSGEYFAKLSQLEQPALILNGDRDPWFPVVGKTLLYDEIPDARLAVFPAAGHAAHHQYPEIVAELVLEFLNTGSEERAK